MFIQLQDGINVVKNSRMGYNRKNILARIIAVQQLVKEYQRKGVTQEFVYREFVYPRYYISRRTFYEYLGTSSPKTELERIEKEESQQLTLF